MIGLFAAWQPRYAEHGIATFPVREKRPVANGLADTFGWGLNRNRRARNRLKETEIETVKAPTKFKGPALYPWRPKIRGKGKKQEGSVS
jgi:hypothetical protein